MPKMHEIIAAEPSVAGVFNAMKEETMKVFDKPDLFLKTVTTKSFFDAEDSKLDTVETKNITTTVQDRLNYLLTKSFSNYLDLQLQKDSTNQIAKADIVINGKELVKDVPASNLLMLEKELKTLRDVVLKAPTLQPGPVWVRDEDENLFVTEEAAVTFQTKKTMRPIVLVAATDKHPAQVEKVNEDIAVAKIEKRTWSGMLTSKHKMEVLGRIDTLLIATKKARQRANGVEVVKAKIGKTLADFILTGPELTEAD